MVDLLLRAAATIEPQPITAFIDCSPLGLCCHVCKVGSIHFQRDSSKSFKIESCFNGWFVGELENGGNRDVCGFNASYWNKEKIHRCYLRAK
jgi:hypothetical protein